MYSTNFKCMPPYTRCALRVGRLEKCSKEVGVRCCRSAGIVTSCANIAKVAEFLQTQFCIDLKSAVIFWVAVVPNWATWSQALHKSHPLAETRISYCTALVSFSSLQPSWCHHFSQSTPRLTSSSSNKQQWLKCQTRLLYLFQCPFSNLQSIRFWEQHQEIYT